MLGRGCCGCWVVDLIRVLAWTCQWMRLVARSAWGGLVFLRKSTTCMPRLQGQCPPPTVLCTGNWSHASVGPMG